MWFIVGPRACAGPAYPLPPKAGTVHTGILYLFDSTTTTPIYVLHTYTCVVTQYNIIIGNNINQQLINFVSATSLAPEIIIPIEFAERLSSFVYFCVISYYRYISTGVAVLC